MDKLLHESRYIKKTIYKIRFVYHYSCKSSFQINNKKIETRKSEVPNICIKYTK